MTKDFWGGGEEIALSLLQDPWMKARMKRFMLVELVGEVGGSEGGVSPSAHTHTLYCFLSIKQWNTVTSSAELVPMMCSVYLCIFFAFSSVMLWSGLVCSLMLPFPLSWLITDVAVAVAVFLSSSGGGAARISSAFVPCSLPPAPARTRHKTSCHPPRRL